MKHNFLSNGLSIPTSGNCKIPLHTIIENHWDTNLTKIHQYWCQMCNCNPLTTFLADTYTWTLMQPYIFRCNEWISGRVVSFSNCLQLSIHRNLNSLIEKQQRSTQMYLLGNKHLPHHLFHASYLRIDKSNRFLSILSNMKSTTLNSNLLLVFLFESWVPKRSIVEEIFEFN